MKNIITWILGFAILSCVFLSGCGEINMTDLKGDWTVDTIDGKSVQEYAKEIGITERTASFNISVGDNYLLYNHYSPSKNEYEAVTYDIEKESDGFKLVDDGQEYKYENGKLKTYVNYADDSVEVILKKGKNIITTIATTTMTTTVTTTTTAFKPKNFKEILNDEVFKELGMNKDTTVVGEDYVLIDTNPDNVDGGDSELEKDGMHDIGTMLAILNFSDSIVQKISRTTAMQGLQSTDNKAGTYQASWTYHPDKGLEILFEKKYEW